MCLFKINHLNYYHNMLVAMFSCHDCGHTTDFLKVSTFFKTGYTIYVIIIEFTKYKILLKTSQLQNVIVLKLNGFKIVKHSINVQV